MTARIHEFLRNRTEDGPCLVVDLEIVRDNYKSFANALPDTRVFYAVKANPAPRDPGAARPPRLLLRHRQSVAEIDLCLALGVAPERISYGNTIKKQRDIAAPSRAGCACSPSTAPAELDKLAERAPGARVYLPRADRRRRRRMAAVAQVRLRGGHGRGAAVPGRLPLGLEAYGISFHVGSQQTDLAQFDRALEVDGRDLPAPRGARRHAPHDRSRRRLPRPLPQRGALLRRLWRGDPARCAAASAPICPISSSSRAAAWSAMPGSSRPRWCWSPRRARR